MTHRILKPFVAIACLCECLSLSLTDPPLMIALALLGSLSATIALAPAIHDVLIEEDQP